jgi:putative ABC transport system permease protein
MLDSMLRDVRYALRLLRLSPGFAIVAIVSLALGTGANTAIFQLLDSIRLRTLPVKAPQELVELRIDDMTHARGTWLRDNALTNPLWERIRERQQVFSGAFAWAGESFDASTRGEFRHVAGLWVSGDFFRVLGVEPILGRVFTRTDDRRGCGLAPGAVVSYGFWQRELGGDASVVGRKVPIGRERIEVIGVTPPGFFGLEVGRTFDIALLICSEPALQGINGRLDSGTTWWLTVMGRLKPGMSMERAAALFQASSAATFEATLPSDYPPVSVKPYRAMKLFAIPAGSGVSRLREQYSRPLVLLLAIAMLVLLIACVNLANLMLARASARQREIAVRLAVGASRSRLARQLVTEGLLLAVSGAGLGLLVARVLSRFLVSFLATGDDPLFIALPQDFRIFAFAAALAILTCLVFALAPVLRSARTEPGEVLKSGSRNATSGRERLGLRRALVASQIAVSLVLLMSALLFTGSLRNLKTLDPGFQWHGILIADVGFSGLQLPPGRAVSFRREMLERLRAIPAVEAADEVTIVPLTGANWNNRLWLDGSDAGHARESLRTMIGTEYFRTLRTPLLAGREFDEHDLASLAKVAVVNQEFARRFTGGVNPVGKRFWIEATPYEPQTSFEIVGFVKNTKYRDLREEYQPVVFIPLSPAALARPGGRFMIRSSAPSDALVAAVRKTLAGISPDMRYSFHFFDTWVQDSLLRERLMATLSALFGVLAVMLTAVGLYGVISYTVARRTNEIGIRIALGADRCSVIALILREVAVVVAAGLGAGSILALAVGRAATALLFGLEPSDPLTLALAAISLAALAAAASCLPAWRASSVNPVAALRQD